ncbi:SAM-dependent methyltransferase [Secundilactobacillus folii]|uniref:SAM-dependent methyltransferase n=1 Tax=Secundilactobacillus folii TaxID=2678357 RepID=UPI0015676E14|nr:SAM-dependent methyltransferase [Secundilactobacillus folii]
MNPKQKKRLLKIARSKKPTQANDYIATMTHYNDLFADFPTIRILINNVLQADRLLKRRLLPQTLPKLLLPDDTQDVIYQQLNAKFPAGDPEGDRRWNELSDALPDLDKKLRNFRDYLETTYGMWAYISAPVAKDVAEFIHGRPTLEVMAGNGYLSKGVRDNHQTVFTTDSKDWTKENETGKHPVTTVEKLTASEAFDKYRDQVNVIIMVWSPDGLDIDWQLLQQIRAADKNYDFIVIGEKDGATDSKTFWQHAKLLNTPDVKNLNQHFTQFDLIHDQVYLVK